jgi:hypothetical protein
MCYDASARRGEAKMQSYSQDLRDRGVMGMGSRGTTDGNCAAAGSQSRLGLPGSRPGAEDGPTHQLEDRRASPFAGSGEGVGAARLDRKGAGSELGRVMPTSGRAGRSDQDRSFVASVEQMEPYLQKKPCAPASKNARTCSRHEERGSKRYPRWKSTGSCLSMKRGLRPA